MQANVAQARLPSGRAVRLGTKYNYEIHVHPPGVAFGVAKSRAGPSLLPHIRLVTV
jgi:hypothetical protein